MVQPRLRLAGDPSRELVERYFAEPGRSTPLTGRCASTAR